jgi:mono/diheme cytochrome c family protein
MRRVMASNCIAQSTLAKFVLSAAMLGGSIAHAQVRTDGADAYHKQIEPILTEYCSDCHADGAKKGGVALDQFKSDKDLLENRELWFNVLKHVRAGIMPPAKKPRPSDEQKIQLAAWIKSAVFQIDPAHPDPGRVTVRRLNRVEYRNTIRDLTGVEFDTEGEFPADDTGYGFDNIGDVLTVSPMLLEKYLVAANTIVSRAVPTVPSVMAEQIIPGPRFKLVARPTTAPSTQTATRRPLTAPPNRGAIPYLSMSFYVPSTASYAVNVPHAGAYRLVLDLTVKGDNAGNGFDANKCRVSFTADGEQFWSDECAWQERKEIHFERDTDWKPGRHQLQVQLEPLTPGVRQTSNLEIRLTSVTVQGPTQKDLWVRPRNFDRFFAKDAPTDAQARRAFAREILSKFAAKAYRRPVDDTTVDRLVSLAESVYSRPGKTFEAGVSQSLVAVLASPRFLFREEGTLPPKPGQLHPLVDEYSLASRLSYFLWSSMPDDELINLAGKAELRKNLAAQVKRMLASPKAEAFTQNFVGQWLQGRDVISVPVQANRVITDFDTIRKTKLLNDRDNRETRIAMETENRKLFDYIVHQNRSVLEFISADYAFVNERLAAVYGIPDVTGEEFRKVTLPPDSPRGGVITSGAVLLVTSNPTRTSPVKRGLFILDNILGTPTPPPPPNIPALEDSRGKFKDHTPTLRETLAAHRANASCASCHNRMDPLGLALENFNAYGIFRDKERSLAIDPSGTLITGEPFKNVVELKQILATKHRDDFYRCLTEKLMTYALGRGLDYYDVEAVDRIVAKLDKEDGHFEALLNGVIDSVPFQHRRNPQGMADARPMIPQFNAN